MPIPSFGFLFCCWASYSVIGVPIKPAPPAPPALTQTSAGPVFPYKTEEKREKPLIIMMRKALTTPMLSWGHKRPGKGPLGVLGVTKVGEGTLGCSEGDKDQGRDPQVVSGSQRSRRGPPANPGVTKVREKTPSCPEDHKGQGRDPWVSWDRAGGVLIVLGSQRWGRDPRLSKRPGKGPPVVPGQDGETLGCPRVTTPREKTLRPGVSILCQHGQTPPHPTTNPPRLTAPPCGST